jgi:hypothetical protein
MIPGYELASKTPMKKRRTYIILTFFAAAIKATRQEYNQCIVRQPRTDTYRS